VGNDPVNLIDPTGEQSTAPNCVNNNDGTQTCEYEVLANPVAGAVLEGLAYLWNSGYKAYRDARDALFNEEDSDSPENPPDLDDFEDPNNLPEGYEWRGNGEPGSREGAYHNPETGESVHDDRTHPEGKEPHWTYTDQDGKRWDAPDDERSNWTPQ
jgi:hypothetical protein